MKKTLFAIAAALLLALPACCMYPRHGHRGGPGGPCAQRQDCGCKCRHQQDCPKPDCPQRQEPAQPDCPKGQDGAQPDCPQHRQAPPAK